MRELHLFAGVGGGILGGVLLGHSCVCAVELDAYCRKVLIQRQLDGMLPRFPVWDDVCTFDGKPWRGRADAVCGGFPCKGISVAGDGTGLDHEESGLWREQARIIGDVRPRVVWVENSPALTLRGGVRIAADLAALGYDLRWGIVSAADAIWSYGTPCLDHLRERIWIYGELADHAGARQEPRPRREGGTLRDEARRDKPERHGGEEGSGTAGVSAGTRLGEGEQGRKWRGRLGNVRSEAPATVAGNDIAGCEEQLRAVANGQGRAECGGWWSAEPGMVRVVSGVPNRVDRLTALGNIQVPAVVKLAWRLLADKKANE